MPDYADAYWNKSLALLLSGRFEEGWKLYEWRWRRSGSPVMTVSDQERLWDGESPIHERTLLVHSEQGFGDTIQFSRLFKHLVQLGAVLVVQVEKELKALIACSFPEIQTVAKEDPLPSFDFHIPLMSLPRVLKCDLLGVPAPTPHLRIPPSRPSWDVEPSPRTAKLRVGLAWSGNPRHGNDRNRSIPLEQLSPYLPDDIEYFCLQREIRAADLPAMRASAIHDMTVGIDNFSDTAALCGLMDVVISVDTSVAHLAAALGRPCWVLLPFTPDWRWQLSRPDCPWYPTVELFRQSENRSWRPVLEAVAHRLTVLREHSSPPSRLKANRP